MKGYYSYCYLEKLLWDMFQRFLFIFKMNIIIPVTPKFTPIYVSAWQQLELA